MLKKLEIKLRYPNARMEYKDRIKRVFLIHINEKNYWLIWIKQIIQKPTISNEIESTSTKIKNKTQKLKEKILCDNKQNKYGRIIKLNENLLKNMENIVEKVIEKVTLNCINCMS